MEGSLRPWYGNAVRLWHMRVSTVQDCLEPPCTLCCDEGRNCFCNTLLELAKVSVSLDLLSACSPNGK